MGLLIFPGESMSNIFKTYAWKNLFCPFLCTMLRLLITPQYIVLFHIIKCTSRRDYGWNAQKKLKIFFDSYHVLVLTAYPPVTIRCSLFNIMWIFCYFDVSYVDLKFFLLTIVCKKYSNENSLLYCDMTYRCIEI